MTRARNHPRQHDLNQSDVLEALATNPGAGKRELVKILGLKSSERIALKQILKELESQGAIRGGRKHGYRSRERLEKNTALEITGSDEDGDLLARPLQWQSDNDPPTIYIMAKKGHSALGPGDRVLARLEKKGEIFQAHPLHKLDRELPSKLIGVVRISPSSGPRLVPIDRKQRREYPIDELGGAKDNEFVAAQPVGLRAGTFSRVKIVERIGNMDSPKSISLIAIHQHGIPTEFSKQALEQAQSAKSVTLNGRTDLRTAPFVTIDPEDARDHDDAVWAGPDSENDNEGGHIVLVAIADVAHYVPQGSPLDQEALKRGNSVYFPDRVVAMLPERLSADLCSLKQGVDRPCLVAKVVLDRHGHKKSHLFLRAVMRSAARLTYNQAQQAFEGKPDSTISTGLRKTLADLWAAYESLKTARTKRDPLDLDLPERGIKLNSNGKIASIAYRERLESMKLIEEFMVLANVAAAEALENAKTPLIYRIHDTPSKEKLFAFSDFLRTLNISFAKGQVLQPSVFNRILIGAKGKPHEAVLNDVVLRSQAQAVYHPANIGHFGLNLARYAHFTSPIRRYADLIVHRALIRAFKLGDGGLTDQEIRSLAATADHITMTERRGMAAERDCTDRYIAAFMEERLGQTFDARISGVTRFGLFVRLNEIGAEGFIPVRSLCNFRDYLRFDHRRQALVGEKSGITYALGDVLRVKLMEAAPHTGGLRFDLVQTSKGAEVREIRFRGEKHRKRGQAKVKKH